MTAHARHLRVTVEVFDLFGSEEHRNDFSGVQGREILECADFKR